MKYSGSGSFLSSAFFVFENAHKQSTRGLFNQEIDIVDIPENKVVGKIKYNTLENKAFIEMKNVFSNISGIGRLKKVD